MTTKLKSDNADESPNHYDEDNPAPFPSGPPVRILLEPEEFDRFVAICQAPPGPPNKKLLEAFDLWKHWQATGELENE